MRVSINVDFEFSGCNYHPPSGLEFHTAETLMRECGLNPEQDYQIWAFRDLLLSCAGQIAEDWPTLEQAIRKDVTDRLGYANGVAPQPRELAVDGARA